jgi:hypothetical protein
MIKKCILWDLMGFSLVEVYRRPSEMLVNFYQTTRRHILKNSVLHVHMSVAVLKILSCLTNLVEILYGAAD